MAKDTLSAPVTQNAGNDIEALEAKAKAIESAEYDTAGKALENALVEIGKLGNNNVLRLAREIGESVAKGGRPTDSSKCLMFILRRTAKNPLSAKQVIAASGQMRIAGKAKLATVHGLKGEELGKALDRLSSSSAKSDDNKTAATIKFGKTPALDVAFE